MHHNLQIKFQFHSPSSSFNDVAGSIVIDMVRNGEHEYTLNLPTGDIRVWRRSLTTAFPSIDWRSHRHLTATMRGVDKLLELHQKVCTLAAGSGSGWIPVVKAGAGPSDKSCKVRVSDVVYRVNADYDEHEIERRVHTLTIPASQLRESDGQLYAPRWLLMRTIHERVLDRKRWPHDIEHGQFLDADMLWAELFAPLQLALGACRTFPPSAQRLHPRQSAPNHRDLADEPLRSRRSRHRLPVTTVGGRMAAQ